MLIQILSSFAVIAGLFGVIPQIISMLVKGSSKGQSAAGWSVGISVNVVMGYVNLVGLHATLLAAGNAVAGALCAFALLCVLRLADDGADDVPAVDGDPVVGGAVLYELPTAEFHVVRAHVMREHARRASALPAERPAELSRRSLRRVVRRPEERAAA